MADFEDYYNLGRAEALIRRPDIFLNEGDVADFEICAAAAMADKNDQRAAKLAAKTYIDTSEGDDLTTLADDHWGIQRRTANEAAVDVTFTRPTAAGGAGTVFADTVVATDKDVNGDDVTFTTDADAVFGAADLTETVAATAEAAGTDGNVGVGEINHIIGAVFDGTIVANNAALAAGGLEGETDDELRERIRLYPSTLRRGTLAALEYGAKTVSGVAIAIAIEDPVTGITDLYVADASGNSSAAMVVAVETEMPNWRAAGTIVNVYGASKVLQAVTVVLTVADGVDVVALTPSIEAAIEARLGKLDPSETLYRTMISTVVQNVRIDEILNVNVTTPATNVVPTNPYDILRAGAITVS